MSVKISRQPIRLGPDPSRVVTRLYIPGGEAIVGDVPRVRLVIDRILHIPEERVATLVEDVVARFSAQHRQLDQALLDHFDAVRRFVDDPDRLSPARRLLIGAYMTGEYAIEAAASCNPSLVAAPDQSSLDPGSRRFILSMRAIGEGHISSIEFRTGIVDREGTVVVDPPSPWATSGRRTAATQSKLHMEIRLRELGVDETAMRRVFRQLGEAFSIEELELALERAPHADPIARSARETARTIHWLAASNYVVDFPPEIPLGERVLVPAGPAESLGMEDARFVRFVDDDGAAAYYATYTAYDGLDVLPQLIETTDFSSFRVSTLDGACALDKGMAIFPRRVGGAIVALSRYDGESLYVIRTGSVRSWNFAERLSGPRNSWELNKIGNCGSPIETEAGWLVLTHGVGPMREYSIGAMLLDIDDPVKVIGRLPEPLLSPEEEDRFGYVPNVVYSCGAMLHRGELVIPYGISDRYVGIATVDVEELLDELLAAGDG